MTKGLKQMTVEAMQADQNKAVKKISAKPKAAPKKVKAPKLFPVAVEDMKIGMTISDHGRVLSAEPMTGRSLFKKGNKHMLVEHGRKAPKGYKLLREGAAGFLFKTTDHEDGCFYTAGSTVWCVKTPR